MKRNILAKVAILSCVALLFSGCDFIDKLMGKKPKADISTVTPETDRSTDTRVQTILVKFYQDLYADPIEASYKNNVLGTVPQIIEGVISDETKKDKLNTAELPIHFPRFVDINGLSCVGYEILKTGIKPEIRARIFETSPDKKYFSYLVEVDLIAKVIKTEDFGTFFRYNPQTRFIDKLAEIPEDKADYIKVRAKYDVTVARVGNIDYKIKSAIESTGKSSAYRLNKINNDFVTRIDYFNAKDPAQKANYDEETSYIKEFMNKMMLIVDKENFNIISTKWATDPVEFAKYMDSLGLLKDQTGVPYLFNVEDKLTYKARFDLKMFPIKPSIEKVTKADFTITEHPSFTEKQRNFRVLVNADVIRTEGQIGSNAKYVYEFTVNVNRSKENRIAINSINLLQFNMIR